MEINSKYITWGIIGAVVLLFITSIVSANNTAVGYEQNIEQSISGIQVQEKRQHDLILQLVQVVEQASQFEAGTQTDIAKLRTAASIGDVQQAQIVLNAVAEAYPTLQANQTYVNLMTEMSISENKVTDYRNSYNTDVRNYKRFVQRFPANVFLGMSGHEIQSYQYLSFDNTELPEDLFGK